MKTKHIITLGSLTSLLLMHAYHQLREEANTTSTSSSLMPQKTILNTYIEQHTTLTQVGEPLNGFDQYVIDSKPKMSRNEFSFTVPLTQPIRYVVYAGIEDALTDTINQSIDVCDGPLQKDGSIIDKLTNRVFIPVINPHTKKNHYVPKDIYDTYGNLPFEYTHTHEFIYNETFSSENKSE